MILCEALPKLQYRSSATSNFDQQGHASRKQLTRFASFRSTNSQNEDNLPAPTRNPQPERRKPEVKDYVSRGRYPSKKVVPKEYFPSLYQSKVKSRRYKPRKHQYDLGSKSGYHWMLYGSPFNRRRHFKARYPLRRRVKSYWKRYAKHLPPKSTFLPPHKARRYVHARSKSAIAGLKGRPIVVSIHPSFKAYNMKSASVLGYGLGALLQDVALATKLKRNASKKRNSYYH